MNLHTLCLIILVLFSTILAAGCITTESLSPTPPVYSSHTPVTDLTGLETPNVSLTPQDPAAVPATLPATLVPARIFNGEYRWAEYRINNTVTHVPGTRTQWEYIAKIERSSEVYHGIPAIHEKITITGDTVDWRGEEKILIPDGFQATETLYFDRSTRRFLGGTFTSSQNGIAQPQQVLPEDKTYCENCRPSWLGINPFDEMNISLSADGEDAVTVPAGTYPDARKYSGYLPDGTPITFWVVPGIPVPVQYRADMGLEGENPMQSFELRGWG